MSRASVFLRVVVGLATLLGLCAVVAVQTAGAGDPGSRPVAHATAPTWSATEAPLPQSTGEIQGVSAVSCPNSGSCVVLAQYDVSTNFDSPDFVDTLSHGKFVAHALPLPSNGNEAFNHGLISLACPTTSSCVAVGSYDVAGNDTFGLINTSSGGRWRAIEAPLPSNATTSAGTQDAGFGFVQCPGQGSCVALGTYVDKTHHSDLFVDTLSGGKWKAKEIPLPSNAGTNGPQITWLSCASSLSCAAVGSYVDSSNVGQGLLVVLSDGTWNALEAPLPKNAMPGGPTLNSVSCPQAGSCTAVGNYELAAGGYGELFETLAGGVWNATQAPALAQPGNLFSISCPTEGSCVAVGATAGAGNGIIETLSDGNWNATVAPFPSNAYRIQSVYLNSVDCPTTGSCVAVGSYNVKTTLNSVGLIETLSGGVWSDVEAPLPANNNDTLNSSLASVGCSGGSCTAIGTYNGRNEGVIEQGEP